MEAATNITKAERVKYLRKVICLMEQKSHFHRAQNIDRFCTSQKKREYLTFWRRNYFFKF